MLFSCFKTLLHIPSRKHSQADLHWAKHNTQECNTRMQKRPSEHNFTILPVLNLVALIIPAHISSFMWEFSVLPNNPSENERGKTAQLAEHSFVSMSSWSTVPHLNPQCEKDPQSQVLLKPIIHNRSMRI